MVKCISRIGGFAIVCLSAGVVDAAPSFCPTSSGAPCAGRNAGDLVISVHGIPSILGVNPNTHTFYVFSSALSHLSSAELGDIAVVPNNPSHVVVIGNVDGGIGIQRLDGCGNIVGPTFGPFPSTLPLPWPPIGKGGINNRGVAFSPVSGHAVSPGMITSFFDGSGPFGALFTFGWNGGAGTIRAAGGDLVDATVRGAVAADEHGTFYLGQSYGSAVSRFNGDLVPPVEASLGFAGTTSIYDMVHDGNGHLFVADNTSSSSGSVLRVQTATGLSQVWAWNHGSFAGGAALGRIEGITIDGAGDIWVVEVTSSDSALVKISGENGTVLDHFPIPWTVDGQPAGGAAPQGIAVLGVNLPAVAEACASACTTGQTTDCFGNCVWADQLFDQFCHDGPHETLNCYARSFDGGDCNPCAAGQMPDCNGNCGPKGWVGDGICDQGGSISLHNGAFIDYDCAEIRYDEATCRSCGPGEVLDCNGNCAPRSWFGDTLCDDGWAEYLGNQIDFDCVEYDFDQHWCH
jgi:hypothetical protein